MTLACHSVVAESKPTSIPDQGQQQADAIRKGDVLVKSKNDNLDYKIITLENGLRAILVSDPDTDKAAASMDVNIGSLLDPPDFLGLAHFTEHMLFYSSEKYPVEDEYSKYISDHGGHTNAYTAAESTNYQFDINWDHFEPALDRFAQFFICPLISADGVDREINAVDSEHGKNLNTDAWRAMQLHKHTANPAHPWARFATGNSDTLGSQPKSKGLDVRQAVVDFHAHYYSANLMRLALYSRHALADMEAMVRAMFSPIVNLMLDKPVMPSDVFLPDQCRKLLRVVPVREVHSLELAWQVPPSTPRYRAGPLNYLSNLLGHEGTGSVFALLKQLGWASALTAGESSSSISSASFFYVRVELTLEGLQHVPDIGALVFRYIQLLRSGGISPAVFDELQALQRMRFDFRDKQAPYHFVTSLSSSMQHYPDADLLLAMYSVPLEYRPDLIAEALEYLTLDNVRVCWSSKTHAGTTDRTEPWYGTQFSLEPIPADWAPLWQQDVPDNRLHLPEPNPFIPTDFTLFADEASTGPPTVVVDVPCKMRVWHKCDVSFNTPKAVIYLDFQSPEAYATPDNAVLTRLFVKLLSDYLNEMAYPAELAGLGYSVSNSQTGFQVVVSGYNDKLLTLLYAILDKVVNFKVREDRFTLVKEDVSKEYSNIKYQQPYQWAMYRRELLLNLRRWRMEEYMEIVAELQPADLEAFFRKMMARCFVEGLAVGNMRRADALALAQHVDTALTSRLGTRPLFPSQLRDFRVVKAPQGATSLLLEHGPDSSNANSAVVVAYQVGPDELRRNALTQLLVHLGKREAFHMLRTQQQLGYIVSMFVNSELSVFNVEFVVQSNVYSAAHLADRIEHFVEHLCETLLAQKCAEEEEHAGAAPTPSADGNDATAHIQCSLSQPQATDVGSDTCDAPTSSSISNGQAGSSMKRSEFYMAVEELAKAKLEKVKRLGELAQRYWNEIYHGALIFHRQEREVEELRSLTPAELRAFAASVLRSTASRRKMLIAIRGTAEAAGAADAAADDDVPASDAAAASSTESSGSSSSSSGSLAETWQQAQAAFGREGSEQVLLVNDIASFKRGCEVFSNAGALYQASRQALELGVAVASAKSAGASSQQTSRL